MLRSSKAGQATANSRRTQFPIIKPRKPARTLTPEIVTAAEERLLNEEGDGRHRYRARKDSTAPAFDMSIGFRS